MTNHLIIPDAHVKPGTSLDRFKWLGQYILDKKPDKIICLGDFADMASLCSYDKGKKDYNSRSYKQDILSVIRAQELLLAPLYHYNQIRRDQKQKQYLPERYMLIGNHENRINRAISLDHVILEGMISLDDLQYSSFGWTVIPFLEKLQLDGVIYSHYFVSGIMGNSVSGEHPAYSIIKKHYMSCTAGHNHLLDISRTAKADGSSIRGLTAGCFLEHKEDYAGPAQDLWWRGVIMKYGVKDGDYALEEVPLEYLRRSYG
jgi:hypothetical protein